MIHFKNRNGFALIESLAAVSVAAIILTPLFILQGTVLQKTIIISEKIERIFIAQKFMHEAQQAAPDDAREFVLEKKINDPVTFLKYQIKPIPKKSSLNSIKNLLIEKIDISWNNGTKPIQETIIRFLYKPAESKK